MKLKGSYTVEATVIISLCFILFGTAATASINLFQSTLAYVSDCSNEINAVEMFRLKEEARQMIEEMRDGN